MGRTEWSVTNLNCPFVENAATLSYLVHAGRRSPVAGGCDARRQRDRGRAKLNELREISESATYLLPRSQSLIPFCVATIRYMLWFKDIGVHVAYKKNTTSVSLHWAALCTDTGASHVECNSLISAIYSIWTYNFFLN